MLRELLPLSTRQAIGRNINSVKAKLRRTDPNEITPYEERVIFDRLKDEMHVVFDIGARDELSFYAMKPDCEYHLFEPNKAFVKLLKKKVAKFDHPHIFINEYGLSDEAKDDCVYYEKSQSFIVNPTFSTGDVDTGKRFSLRTLDWYVTENAIPQIDYLKIDAEGLDYKILLGARKTLEKNVSYLQFEYWDGVRKFSDLLSKNFTLYLILDPTLRKIIKQTTAEAGLPNQDAYDRPLLALDESVIALIDDTLIPMGCGGNILAVSKREKGLDMSTL